MVETVRGIVPGLTIEDEISDIPLTKGQGGPPIGRVLSSTMTDKGLEIEFEIYDEHKHLVQISDASYSSQAGFFIPEKLSNDTTSRLSANEYEEILDALEVVEGKPEQFYPVNRAARRNAEKRNRALQKRDKRG